VIGPATNAAWPMGSDDSVGLHMEVARSDPVSPRGQLGPRRSSVEGCIRGVGNGTVRVRTLIAHTRRNHLHNASSCSSDFAGVTDVAGSGSHAPPHAPSLVPPLAPLVNPIGAELNRSPTFFLGAALHLPPPSLNGSVWPSSPKTRAHDPCQLGRLDVPAGG
jgi:hypothetical protein